MAATPSMTLPRTSRARVELGLLRQVADGDALGGPGLALEVLVLAGHDPQQRGLARAVDADDADLHARQEGEADVLEDLLAAGVGLGEAVHVEDVLRAWPSRDPRGCGSGCRRVLAGGAGDAATAAGVRVSSREDAMISTLRLSGSGTPSAVATGRSASPASSISISSRGHAGADEEVGDGGGARGRRGGGWRRGRRRGRCGRRGGRARASGRQSGPRRRRRGSGRRG